MLIFFYKDRVGTGGVTPRNVIWSHPLLYLLIWEISLFIFKSPILVRAKPFLKIFLRQDVSQKSNHWFFSLKIYWYRANLMPFFLINFSLCPIELLRLYFLTYRLFFLWKINIKICKSIFFIYHFKMRALFLLLA